MVANPMYPQLNALVEQLKADVFRNWMFRAQRAALLDWRDRQKAPGLRARFTDAGAKHYGFFSSKRNKGKRGRGDNRPYYESGKYHDMVVKRKPKGRRSERPHIRTTFNLGGGVMNILRSRRPFGRVATRQFGPQQWASHDVRSHTRRGGVTVAAYRRGAHTRNVSRVRLVTMRSSQTFAQEFADMSKDSPYIQRRVRFHFFKILRNARFTSKGRRSAAFVSKYLDDLDEKFTGFAA